LKEYLSQKGLTFEEHNVAADKAAAREMIEKSKAMSVPVTVIDDKDVVTGFNKAKLDELLA
jgi:glutaredoxin